MPKNFFVATTFDKKQQGVSDSLRFPTFGIDSLSVLPVSTGLYMQWNIFHNGERGVRAKKEEEEEKGPLAMICVDCEEEEEEEEKEIEPWRISRNYHDRGSDAFSPTRISCFLMLLQGVS